MIVYLISALMIAGAGVYVGYRYIKSTTYLTYLTDHCLEFQVSVGGIQSARETERCGAWANEYYSEKHQHIEFCIDRFTNIDACLQNDYRVPPWPLGIPLPPDAADCRKVYCYNF
jgi:hypothetical protein